MILMTATPKSLDFELTGGALCLDFANTLGDRPRSTEEHLGDYDDLLRFGRQAEVLVEADLDELERQAEKHPRRARAAFERSIELREALYRIFGRLARTEVPAVGDILLLNSALREVLPNLQIRDRGSGFEWTWSGPAHALDSLLWPVVRSAAELLTSEEAKNLRECAAETCSWLFVDRSRNHRRRWCDMATCGNRAKARRHYQRRKQGRAAG
jgi:predicted RNA-binding Zn ribbon-like protein